MTLKRAQQFSAVDQTVAEVHKREAREQREREEAAALHFQHPGRWGDHASPARQRRDIERDREEDER